MSDVLFMAVVGLVERFRWAGRSGWIELEQFSRLAIQGAADRLERREADGLGFTGLEDGKVGESDAYGFRKFGQGHLASREGDIEADDDGHGLR